MTLQELQNQALRSPLPDRWHLVQFLLGSIQRETVLSPPLNSVISAFTGLHPWTQSLMGVIRLESTELVDVYVDYLEGKYG
jgi:hypothetical protein